MLGEYKACRQGSRSRFLRLPGGWQSGCGRASPSITSNREKQIQFRDMRDRLLFIRTIETVRCFEEGVLESVRDANIGSIFGPGFAPWSVVQSSTSTSMAWRSSLNVPRCWQNATVHLQPAQIVAGQGGQGESFT